MEGKLEHAFYGDESVGDLFLVAHSHLAAGLFDEALTTINKHLKSHPDDIRAHTVKARALSGMGKRRKAIKHMDSLWDKKNVSPDMMLVMSIQYSQMNAFDRALGLIEAASGAGAERADVCYAHGIVGHTLTVSGHKGLIDEAGDRILEASKLDGGRHIAIESAVANILLSKYHHSKSKDSRLLYLAIKHAKRSIKLGDDDYLTYYNMGRAYYFMNKPKLALPYLEDAHKMNPGFVDGPGMIGAAMVAMDNMPRKYYEKALELLEAATSADPTMIFAIQSKVWAHEVLGDDNGVKTTLVELTEADPTDIGPWTMLFCIYYKEGDEHNADVCLNRAREINPKIPPAQIVFDFMRRSKYDWRLFNFDDVV